MSDPVIRFAESDEDRERAFRLRYQVYNTELSVFSRAADHDRGRSVDPADEFADLLLAEVDGDLVGTMQLNLGGKTPLLDAFEEKFSISHFLDAVPWERCGIQGRFAVNPEQRKGPVPFLLMRESARFGLEHKIELSFVRGLPHLCRVYMSLGFRPYRRLYDDPEEGVTPPLVNIVRDIEHHRAISSPLLQFGLGLEEDGTSELAERARRLLPASAPVRLPEDIGFDRIFETLDDAPGASPFDGLSAEEAAELMAGGLVYELAAGDRLMRRGQGMYGIYVVLGGGLEAISGETAVRGMGPGEVVGEVAYTLRDTSRTMDVVAAEGGARVLCLSDSAIRKVERREDHVALGFHRNLSKTMAERLASPPNG